MLFFVPPAWALTTTSVLGLEVCRPSHCPLLSDPPQNGAWSCRQGGLWARTPRGHRMSALLQDPATHDSRPSAPTHRGTGRRCLPLAWAQEPWGPTESSWHLAPSWHFCPSQTHGGASSQPLHSWSLGPGPAGTWSTFPDPVPGSCLSEPLSQGRASLKPCFLFR